MNKSSIVDSQMAREQGQMRSVIVSPACPSFRDWARPLGEQISPTYSSMNNGDVAIGHYRSAPMF